GNVTCDGTQVQALVPANSTHATLHNHRYLRADRISRDIQTLRALVSGNGKTLLSKLSEAEVFVNRHSLRDRYKAYELVRKVTETWREIGSWRKGDHDRQQEVEWQRLRSSSTAKVPAIDPKLLQAEQERLARERAQRRPR